MQSGSLLHLALLRKTSTAKTKERRHMKRNSNISCPMGEENFTLCGWSTEENQFKEQLRIQQNKQKIQKLEDIVRQNPKDKKKTDISCQKRNSYFVNMRNARIPTSDNYREKLKSQSQRICPQSKPSISNTSLNQRNVMKTPHSGYRQKNSKKKEVNSHHLFKPVNKYTKLTFGEDQKENNTILVPSLLLRQNYQSKGKNKQPVSGERKSFANFINFTSIKSRKFFKA